MSATLDYAPVKEFDPGLFVARYLQVLAWLSIASMLVSLLYGSLRIDLSPIFDFWAASELKKHNRRARLWVIWLSALMLMATLAMFAWAVIGGTADMHLLLGVVRIDNPALWKVAMVP